MIDQLKELGKKANEVILDLDTKLNGVNRMKEHEKDNYTFEMENIRSEFQYICAEMEGDYKVKEAKAQQELNICNSKKEE